MQGKTAKTVVGQHHWVDWSECRRCCENDTRSWCLEKLRIWPQRPITRRHNDDDDCLLMCGYILDAVRVWVWRESGRISTDLNPYSAELHEIGL